MAAASVLVGRHTSAICRLGEGRERWRVTVETWPEQESYRGRLIFQRDDCAPWEYLRQSAPLLSGSTREDVVALAHDVPEDRLRQLLHSLG